MRYLETELAKKVMNVITRGDWRTSSKQGKLELLRIAVADDLNLNGKLSKFGHGVMKVINSNPDRAINIIDKATDWADRYLPHSNDDKIIQRVNRTAPGNVVCNTSQQLIFPSA